MLFGQKEIFAIELDFTHVAPMVMGHCCLWIEGKQFGTYEDDAVVYPFLSDLQGLIRFRDSLWESQFSELTDYELFELLKNGSDRSFNQNFYGFIGTNYDDFINYNLFHNDKYIFLWELAPSFYFSYENLAVGQLQSGSVDAEYFETVFAEFNEYLKPFWVKRR
jgi:hypothetical protein